jgi:hypothetical protein
MFLILSFSQNSGFNIVPQRLDTMRSLQSSFVHVAVLFAFALGLE